MIINNKSMHDCLFKVLSIIIYGNEINYIIIKNNVRTLRFDKNKMKSLMEKYVNFFKDFYKYR